jgi:hypothetical protein
MACYFLRIVFSASVQGGRGKKKKSQGKQGTFTGFRED